MPPRAWNAGARCPAVERAIAVRAAAVLRADAVKLPPATGAAAVGCSCGTFPPPVVHMNIRITHIDGKLPNLALMTIAQHHRLRGDEIHFTTSVERGLFEPVALPACRASSASSPLRKGKTVRRTRLRKSGVGLVTQRNYTCSITTSSDRLARPGVPALKRFGKAAFAYA